MSRKRNHIVEGRVSKGGQNPPNPSTRRPAAPECSGERDFKSFTFGHCNVCGTPLCTKGGCANTGLCGPCCTGEADTAGEF